MTKIPNFENSRWRTAAILKIVISLYLGRKSSDLNEIWDADTDCASKVGYLTKYQKKFQIQNGGRPPYWKSSFGYISTNDCPINAKCCTIKQNHVPTQDTWPKYRYQISKIQDGGRPPFENSFIAITQPGIIRFQRNLVCSRKLCFQGRSHNKVPQFCKFYMADGRHNENRFSAISGRFIVWLPRNFIQRSIITLRHRLHDQNTPAVDIWTAIIKQQI